MRTNSKSVGRRDDGFPKRRHRKRFDKVTHITLIKNVRTGQMPDPHVLGFLRMSDCNRCHEPDQAQCNEWYRHV